MSNISEMDLDLEKLFQPAWAQEKPPGNRFEKFTGNEGGRPERKRDHGGPRGDSFGARRESRPPRSGGKFGVGKKDFRRDEQHGEHRPARRDFAPSAPLPEISVTFLPVENGVESLARQIKMTGRAYPLFQIAQLVLEKPERYSVQLAVKKKSGDAVAQQLFVCALDDTPWLSEDEAVAHILKNHFATFYQAERTPTEPPKGVYTFVAQCGLSGAILGPPNHHDYQNQLHKLHAEKFSRMPFEVFKSRMKIVRDEAVVKKWVEDQSFKTEFVCLNVPEPLRLGSMEDVEKHFRATHKDSIIKQVETHTVAGVPSRNLRSRELQQLVRAEWEQQKYFPLQLAMALSKQFASHGLQFFKVNKTVTHVAVARPQFLDLETTPVSENIKRLVEYINAHPKCTRRKLIEALAPSPKPVAEGETPAQPAQSKSAEPTLEQTALIADLHWLIHQGHVLEFADGKLDAAKKPMVKPPKPEKKPVEETKSAEEKSAEVKSSEPEIAAEVAATESEIKVQPADKTSPAIEATVEPAEIAPAETPAAEEIPSPS